MERENDQLFGLIVQDDFHPPIDLGRHGTVLGMLYDAYTELNNTETQAVKQAFEALYALLDRTRGADAEEIANAVCDLCREHEKAGFIDGVRVGVRLAQEANIK